MASPSNSRIDVGLLELGMEAELNNRLLETSKAVDVLTKVRDMQDEIKELNRQIAEENEKFRDKQRAEREQQVNLKQQAKKNQAIKKPAVPAISNTGFIFFGSNNKFATSQAAKPGVAHSLFKLLGPPLLVIILRVPS